MFELSRSVTCKRGLLHGSVHAKQLLGVSLSLWLCKIRSSLPVQVLKRFIVLLINTVLRKKLSGSSMRCSLCSDKFSTVCFSLPPRSASDSDIVVLSVAAFDALRLFGLSTICNMKQTSPNIYETIHGQHVIRCT